ncbi:hypothetical protein ACVTYA_13295 [Enterococcus hirae]|uniref:hypothetical protein n=1 Tax=Enterococcus faecium TaxID=1352 RepID=UPI000DEB4477|nr:hypothetical protein [Enterococcus faecium]RBT20086.1 hypothetical protein EB00_02733 [Enterococcus faecium]
MENSNLNHYQTWVTSNLITRKQAAEITGQSFAAFSQTIKQGRIKPFVEIGEGSGPGMVRLYLKSDIEAYAKQLQAKKQRQQ